MMRLYRLLLLAYPAPIRRAFGGDMIELLSDLMREELRTRGRLAACLVALRTFGELPFSAAEARRSSGKPRRSNEQPTPSSPPQRPARGSVSGLFERVLQNLSYTVRCLRRSPSFAGVVVLTLAVGIGANTVMFTVLDGILLSPLPYHQPDRLVRVYNAWPDAPERKEFVMGSGFLAYREQTQIFDGLAAAYTYRQAGADLTLGDVTERIVVMPISSGFFELLGVEPMLGREFSLAEETPDSGVAIISYDLWHVIFDADPAILGREIDLQGTQRTVVGVMPPGFRNPIGDQVDLWRPENLQPGGRNSWTNSYLSAIGRLREGVSLAHARQELMALGVSMEEADEGTYGAFATIYPLLDETVGETSVMLWMLMGAVGLVLLIACVNVASLFLVRSAERGKELAIRAALGAGRLRLVGQMLGESLLLGVVGGVAGLLLSVAGLRAVVAMSPASLPRIAELGIDLRMFVFATVASVLAGLLFGLAPALQFSRPDLDRTLRESDRGNSGDRAHRRLRGTLVVAEISLALVLLFGAGLLIKSFRHLAEVDLGIQPGGVLTYEVHLPDSRYPEGADRSAFYARFFERVRTIPGVEAIGATSFLPGEGRYNSWAMGRNDKDLDDSDNWIGTDMRIIDGDYPQLMGIELIRGRTFSDTDTAAAQGVMLLNESLAAAAFPDRDPLGGRVTINGEVDYEIVGIVADTAYDPLGSVSSKAYLPHVQYADDRNWPMIQTVRTTTDPTAIAAQLRAELRQLDPQLVLYRLRTMDDIVAQGIAPQRFAMALMMGFAGTALLLAAMGIYGVLSYTVAQRTHEIGIRVALGADRDTVRGMVMRQALMLTGVGVALGVVGALAMSGWMASMLFEVGATDPVVLGAVVGVLGLIAALAAYVPARRATRVDPMRALRG